MNEAAARRVLLAQAVESIDAPAPLIAAADLRVAERDARQEALASNGRAGPDAEAFVDLRARRVLAAAGVRHPWVPVLLEQRGWGRWSARLLPAVALVLGVLSDVVGDPHRVDLLSLPLLGIIVWNIVVYALLVLEAVLPRSHPHGAWLSRIARSWEGARGLARRPGNARLQLTARFQQAWFVASRAMQVERIKRVLHLSAASWAVGVMASLLVRGLVVEYRVGWESTFLGPEQVRGMLAVLRLPALLLFPFPPVSLADVAAMRFGQQAGGAAAGAQWVWMYCALLVTVVVVPRLALAAVAWWHERRCSRGMQVDMLDPYFARILSLLETVVVQLSVFAPDPEDAAAFRRVVAQDAVSSPAALASEQDDVLRVVDFSDATSPREPPRSKWRIWPRRGAPDPERAIADATDVLVAIARNPAGAEAVRAVASSQATPVLLVIRDDLGMNEEHAGIRALRFSTFGVCWIQQGVLRDAISGLLPPEKAAGFRRLAQAWEARNMLRMREAMDAIAAHVAAAARLSSEVHAGTLGVRSVLGVEREAQELARRRAMDDVATQLDASASRMSARLCELHAVAPGSEAALAGRIEESFHVQQPVHAQQAGIAGAATGAAMGASVDVLLGGLTLGAAAALGALVGGGAAWIGAAWRNRATPSGATLVQLSDPMLFALLEGALLRYLAVVHAHAPLQAVDATTWRAVVSAATQAHAVVLKPLWGALRTSKGPAPVQSLAHECESIGLSALGALYPGARPS